MNVLLTLVLLLVPIKPETGHFTIYQDGKKIGTEDFTISLRTGGYVAQGRTQLSVGNQNFDLKSRMELDEQLRPTFYEYESKGNIIRLRVGTPTSELEYVVGGKPVPHDVRFPSNGAIIDDNFFHHYLLLLYRAGVTASSIPTFVPQQLTLGTLNVRSTGNHTYEIETSDVKLTATTDADGRMIRLTRPDAKVIVER